MPDDSQPPPQPRRWRHWQGWLVNLVLIMLIVVGVDWWKSRPLAAGTAPPLAGMTLDGTWRDLAAPRDQPALVYFWASWCPLCKMTNGAVAAIARDHPVLSVAMQSGGPAELSALMRESGLDLPVIADPDGSLASRWGVVGVPTAFVVDPNGAIRAATVGLSSETGLRLRLWLARYLD
ncbi:MAG: protein disulfide oxidoreductase [Sphingobacteriia bacterium]|nr:protein disulfide oxidoreductase [Sphingobacteriia bacterium]NCC40745.1 protein disulfide oxidoreductase [Gammaproteobacteria bacterium]